MSQVDTPCTGVCRIVDSTDNIPRCISCHRTYKDIEEWIYLSRTARLKRMEQLKRESNRSD